MLRLELCEHSNGSVLWCGSQFGLGNPMACFSPSPSDTNRPVRAPVTLHGQGAVLKQIMGAQTTTQSKSLGYWAAVLSVMRPPMECATRESVSVEEIWALM